jgi:hypothetical protein
MEGAPNAFVRAGPTIRAGAEAGDVVESVAIQTAGSTMELAFACQRDSLQCKFAVLFGLDQTRPAEYVALAPSMFWHCAALAHLLSVLAVMDRMIFGPASSALHHRHAAIFRAQCRTDGTETVLASACRYQFRMGRFVRH